MPEMGDEKYSIGYFAKGASITGTVLFSSGIILIITGVLLATASWGGISGPHRYWFFLLFAGFMAVVPGALLLLLSQRLKKM